MIPGVEIQTQEEVHVLGLFKNVEDAEGFGSKLYMYLPDMMNKETILVLNFLLMPKIILLAKKKECF